MNAGAYGGEFKDIVLETTYFDGELDLKTIQNKEHKFGYRYSIFDETNDTQVPGLTPYQKNYLYPCFYRYLFELEEFVEHRSVLAFSVFCYVRQVSV